MRHFEHITGEEFERLRSIFSQFKIDGDLKEIHRLHQGHLHTTFVSSWNNPISPRPRILHDQESSRERSTIVPDSTRRYLHQRVNRIAFPETEKMLENTSIIVGFLSSHPQYSFPARLNLVSTHSHDSPFLPIGTDFWRTYDFVEQSTSHDNCPNITAALNLGRATGDFLFLLSSLDNTLLYDHFPRFHDTLYRWQNLEQAIRNSSDVRLHQIEPLLLELNSFRSEAERISQAVADGSLPKQIIHGDTKVNNFLFREGTNEILCLVDIDLCMFATPLFDFGDLVRSASVRGREDEPNLERVSVHVDFIAALTQGFASSRYVPTQIEKQLLPLAPFTISFNLTLRFLTDYLEGDNYFPVTHPEHNRDRAAAQLKVTRELYAYREIIGESLLV